MVLALTLAIVPGVGATQYSYSAYVDLPTWVHKRPNEGSKRVARLQTQTFHGSLEVVMVLRETLRGGKRWSRVRYAGLGDRRGWVPSRVLSDKMRHEARLVIDRRRLRITLSTRDWLLFSAPIGVGAQGSPTPAGHYYVRERIVPPSANSIYGALAFGTSAYSPFRTDWPGGGQVGVHGTNQPQILPGYVSNGCVRLRNRDVLRLGRMLRVGTPVLVR